MMAKEYREDLALLRSLSPVTIIQREVSILQSLTMKYGMDDRPTIENFWMLKGKLSSLILKKLESYVYKEILDGEPVLSAPTVLDEARKGAINKTTKTQTTRPEMFDE